MANQPPVDPRFPERSWQLVDERGPRGGLRLFPLDLPVLEWRPLSALLSQSERARAARFLAAEHGVRYTVAHARLRQLLAAELGGEPGSLQFIEGPHGKPDLHGAASDSGLRFNLSHSGGAGLVGWSWGCEIGVDVEVWRAMRDEAALVRRYFSSAEITAWERLPVTDRTEAFFNLWTRKEAYIKALGRGLSLPLDSFDVSHENGTGARLLRASEQGGSGPWSLAAPAVGAGVSAAVVLNARAFQLVPVDPA